MQVSKTEKTILRELARQVAEVADLPVMARRREMWKRHNSLEDGRPLVLVFPEGGWRELLPGSDLACTGEKARKIEWTLRRRLFHHEHLHDDGVIEKAFIVSKTVRSSGWGLEPRYTPSSQDTGAWKFDPVIHGPDDLKKLKSPDIHIDEDATRQDFDLAQNLFGDILDVELKGIAHVSFHLMSQYTRLRGLKEAMTDMALEPAMVRDAMAFLEEGHQRLIRQYIELELLELNNDGTYQSSGGNGYTDELPGTDFDAEHVRPRDMWASAESQEMAQVSPRMHNEFVLEYEKRLLEPFGLSGYGCCEDLTDKLDYVCAVPNMRRISISPWADVDRCAERLGGDYIFSWKPHPSHLVGEFHPDAVRDYLRRAIAATKNCVVEIILKDTHTCEHHPERFTQWTDIARREVENAG